MTIVLIVGGAGFIGSHLVDRCLEEDHTVHVITKPTTDLYRLEGYIDLIHVHQLDINNHGALERLLGEIKPELIYHLAIATRRETAPHLGDAFASVKEDLLGLLSVLAAAEANGPPRMFIRTGSLADYGRTPVPHVESAREVPQSVYAAGLVAAVHYVEALQARLPFPVITARLSLVYGPDQSDEFFIPSMIKQCLSGRASIVHNPDARRDLIYVDDVVDALRSIAASNLPGGTIVNIASGEAPTMAEVAHCILNATDADPKLVSCKRQDRTHDVDLVPSPLLAKELLGWSAKTESESRNRPDR